MLCLSPVTYGNAITAGCVVFTYIGIRTYGNVIIIAIFHILTGPFTDIDTAVST